LGHGVGKGARAARRDDLALLRQPAESSRPTVGYEVVKFLTSFANKPGALETVSLGREDGIWRLSGTTIE
jgi:hypothetical protein